MTWIAYGDYSTYLQSSPWSSYNTDNALQGYYDFNGSSMNVLGIAIVPAGNSPAPAPAPQPSPALAETGVSTLPYLAAGLLMITLGMGLFIVRRKQTN